MPPALRAVFIGPVTYYTKICRNGKSTTEILPKFSGRFLNNNNIFFFYTCKEALVT